jgi:hypothetical protein
VSFALAARGEVLAKSRALPPDGTQLLLAGDQRTPRLAAAVPAGAESSPQVKSPLFSGFLPQSAKRLLNSMNSFLPGNARPVPF